MQSVVLSVCYHNLLAVYDIHTWCQITKVVTNINAIDIIDLLTIRLRINFNINNTINDGFCIIT